MGLSMVQDVDGRGRERCCWCWVSTTRSLVRGDGAASGLPSNGCNDERKGGSRILPCGDGDWRGERHGMSTIEHNGAAAPPFETLSISRPATIGAVFYCSAEAEGKRNASQGRGWWVTRAL